MSVETMLKTGSRLTPEHEETVKATISAIGAKIEEITPLFYKKMFTAHPELIANTFNRGNQKSGAQQKALAASVVTFASMLIDPDAPDPVDLLSRIAHKHVSLGITEDQYQIVYENLFAAIVDVLGADVVTPDVAEAWTEVYDLMAAVLIAAEKDLYDERGVAPGDVFRKAEVIAKEQLTETVTQYVLAGDFTAPKPGQYTSVGVELPDGARQLRQYSIVDGDATQYRIVVNRDGEVSGHLQDNVEVGDLIDATLAAGDLVLDETEHPEAPVVLISSGIGSTPMVGMLSYLADTASERRVTVLHADENRDSHAQAVQTETLVTKLPNVTYRTSYRDAGELIDIAAEIPAGADVYLCGGNLFLQNIRGQLAALDGDASPVAVHFELFSPNDWLV